MTKSANGTDAGLGRKMKAILEGTPDLSKCPKCGHPNHKSVFHKDICTHYVEAMGAECGCSHPQEARA